MPEPTKTPGTTLIGAPSAPPPNVPFAAPPPAAAAVQPPTMTAVPYEVFRRQTALQAQMEAAGLEMDETTEGGKYQQPDGSFVNADGKPLKDAKD